MKECPKCRLVKPLLDFSDPKLESGFGRICSGCKARKVKVLPPSRLARVLPPKEIKAPPVYGKDKCPRCSSSMVLRTRSRDAHKFYGCSRFPKCKGTRDF
jgi:ssDNA-binding Zn-finger/Zn-ribbon topoisomerase 1